MIREFWQERREEKRKQKELKKQNKKLPKSREERAYKIFGVFFVLFLIFGSIFSTCSCNGGGLDGYSWDKIIGITDEIKANLTVPVNKDDLIQKEEINAIDWSICQDKLNDVGLNIILNNKINSELLLAEDLKISSELVLNDIELGCLIENLIDITSLKDSINLIELNLYEENSRTFIRGLFNVELSAIVISDSLPSVFVTTISKLEVLDEKLFVMNSELQINKLSDSANEDALDVLNKSSLVGLETYTSNLLDQKIKEFATCIKANVSIEDCKIKFTPMGD